MPQNQHEQKPAAQTPQVVDLTDPKVLMGVLAQMLQSQAQTAQSMAESNAINKRLLEIKGREEEARLKKDAEALEKWQRARDAALSELKHYDTNQKRRWASCSHQDQKLNWTIWPISNYPDGRLRGYCTGCGMPIEPEHYEFDAYGKKTLVPEHPMYKLVLQRDQQLYSPFLPVMNY